MDKKQEFHRTAHMYLVMMIAFCLPIARLTPIFISLLLLNWLLEGDLKKKMRAVLENKLALLFIGFYILHLLGLIYTANMDSGLFDIQVKLSLFVFPLVFASRPLSSKDADKVFFSLIAGGITASVIMLARAFYTYFAFGENNFFYEAFSFLIHPSYLSMYMNVVIAWLFLKILRGGFEGTRFSNVLAVLVILFFSVVIGLLSSKLGLITLLLLLVFFLGYYVLTRKKYLFAFIGVALIIGLIVSVMKFVPELRDRLTAMVTAVTAPATNQAEMESTAVRMLVWKAANQVISGSPVIGVGTGDAKDELMKEYQRRGMTGAIEHKLNAHCEFYQVTVALGAIGLLFLVLGIFIPLIRAFRNRDLLYLLFLSVIILNFLPESMLETQAGVMFYAFMNSMFCFLEKEKEPALKYVKQ